MTEAEWMNCTDPEALWTIVRERFSLRKIRLFGVAFCGVLRKSLRYHNAVSFEPWAERVANGLMSLDAARASISSDWGEDHFFRGLLEDDPGRGVARILALSGLPNAEEEAQRRRSAHDLIRCIGGNPFRPPTIDPASLDWNGGTVRRLAEAAYQDRDLPAGTLDAARLAVLADALEEAGCDNADILNHCRQPGVHVRGCWVLDLVRSVD